METSDKIAIASLVVAFFAIIIAAFGAWAACKSERHADRSATIAEKSEKRQGRMQKATMWAQGMETTGPWVITPKKERAWWFQSLKERRMFFTVTTGAKDITFEAPESIGPRGLVCVKTESTQVPLDSSFRANLTWGSKENPEEGSSWIRLPASGNEH